MMITAITAKVTAIAMIVVSSAEKKKKTFTYQTISSLQMQLPDLEMSKKKNSRLALNIFEYCTKETKSHSGKTNVLVPFW